MTKTNVKSSEGKGSATVSGTIHTGLVRVERIEFMVVFGSLTDGSQTLYMEVK